MKLSNPSRPPGRRRYAWGVAATVALAVALVVGTTAGGADANVTGVDATAPSAPSASSVDLARLSITVTTTSDWTKVHLAPAVARFAAVASNPAAVTTSKINDGVAVTNVPTGGATVTLNVLAEDLTSATSFTATVEKGVRGSTTVQVINTSAAAFTVTTLTDQATSSATNPVSVTLNRQQLFGSVEPALPHADPRHLVLAFYYPWFGKASFDSPLFVDQPASGPYSSWDPTAVTDMTKQARANGIDGFIVSWSGNDRDGAQFDVARQAAGATGGYITGYIETLMANAQNDPTAPADPAVVQAWLDQLLSRSSDPAFLTSGGVPVVFVYGMYRLPVSAWTQILSTEAAAGHPVRLVGDGSLPTYASVMWGSHLYNPNQLSYDALSSWNHGRLVVQRGAASVDATVAPKLYAATVSPGFDNRKISAAHGGTGTYVSRGSNGERYQLTWDAALANDPDWVLVTTWNEWYEGTTVQPGVVTGDLALQQTKANADKF